MIDQLLDYVKNGSLLISNTLWKNFLANNGEELDSFNGDKKNNHNIPVITISPNISLDESLKALDCAKSYAEWAEAANNLDKIKGNDIWKETDADQDYDYISLKNALLKLRKARTESNISTLLFLIRTTWTKDFANLNNSKLYRHSYIGTKKLIQNYIDECLNCLEFIANFSTDSTKTYWNIIENLSRAQQSYGHTALLLSGGGTFGMLHSGVMTALYEQGALPKIIAGSSAGAIIASVTCSKSPEELPELIASFINLNFDAFEKTGEEESLYVHVARMLKHGSWIDISYLASIMEAILGNLTFQEAYNRSHRILNITVSSSGIYEVPRLLNYLTAPNVLVRSAVCASCALPFVFTSYSLLAKDINGNIIPWSSVTNEFVDGSVDNDLPISRVAELFNVNYFIVSQVNPHIAPFLKKDEEVNNINYCPYIYSRSKSQMMTDELIHWLNVLEEMDICQHLCLKLKSVFSQSYRGDITLLPEIRNNEMSKILKNPTKEFMMDTNYRGERATWPRITHIKNHCALEIALDSTINRIRYKLVSEFGCLLRPFSPFESIPCLKINPKILKEKSTNDLLKPRVSHKLRKTVSFSNTGVSIKSKTISHVNHSRSTRSNSLMSISNYLNYSNSNGNSDDTLSLNEKPLDQKSNNINNTYRANRHVSISVSELSFIKKLSIESSKENIFEELPI